jgi:hypothetical protein
MAKSFADDGALGAGDNNGLSTDTGGGLGRVTMSDPGPGVQSDAGSNPTPPSGTESMAYGSGLTIDPGNIPAYQQSGQQNGGKLGPGVGAGQSIDPRNLAAYGWNFEDGGAIPDSDGDDDGDSAPADSTPQDGGGDSDGSPGQSSMASALNAVDQVMQHLYSKYGLSDGDSNQQVADNMPAAPGTQSDSGVRTIPAPGPLVPNANPFGRRQGQPFGRVASNMPTVPASQSDSGVIQIPGPGTLAPSANPFGKRQVRPPQPSQGAIPDDDDQETA